MPIESHLDIHTVILFRSVIGDNRSPQLCELSAKHRNKSVNIKSKEASKERSMPRPHPQHRSYRPVWGIEPLRSQTLSTYDTPGENRSQTCTFQSTLQFSQYLFTHDTNLQNQNEFPQTFCRAGQTLETEAQPRSRCWQLQYCTLQNESAHPEHQKHTREGEFRWKAAW